MARRGPRSSIDLHLSASAKSRLEAALRAKEPLERIAARSEKAFGRHIPKSTLGKHRKQLLAKGAPRRLELPPLPVVSGVDPNDARAVVLENLRALRACLTSADVNDVPRIAQAITSATRLLARITGQLEVSQKMIIDSPYFERVAQAVEAAFTFEGLRSQVECMQAFESELLKIESEEK